MAADLLAKKLKMKLQDYFETVRKVSQDPEVIQMS
jgi:hypothetical protein